jgi:hypothetical protein
MDFNIRLDDTAQENLPGVSKRKSGVTVGDSDLSVQLGNDFEATIPLNRVEGAELLADPRPGVYLTMGISAAVENLGRDTVAVVGSYDGLVTVNFKEMVGSHVRPTGPTSNTSEKDEGAGTIRFQHLILSLEQPEEFVNALNGSLQNAGVSARPAAETSQSANT